MANYSKDMDRQNKALKDLMSGKEYEKDYIQVGYEGKPDKNLQGKTRETKMTGIMKDVRMPWFCPSCKKTMKKKLDNKFWRIENQCFDCHVEMENKLRMTGEYETYEKSKILENKKAYLKDLKQSIDEFEQTDGKAEFFNEVGVVKKSVEKENWSMGQENFDKLVKEARDHIEKLETELADEQKINTV